MSEANTFHFTFKGFEQLNEANEERVRFNIQQFRDDTQKEINGYLRQQEEYGLHNQNLDALINVLSDMLGYNFNAAKNRPVKILAQTLYLPFPRANLGWSNVVFQILTYLNGTDNGWATLPTEINSSNCYFCYEFECSRKLKQDIINYIVDLRLKG